MIDRRGNGWTNRTSGSGTGTLLLVVILSASVSSTLLRAAVDRGPRTKPQNGSVSIPGDATGAALQPACGGDAANLLYPLDASTIGDWSPALPPCDDCASDAIPLGFTFKLYDDSYGEVFVNNNGNLSFGEALVTFWPTGFPDDRYANVAPFYADADTRENPDPAVPSDVHRRFVDGNGDGVPETFVATWRNIGYYERSFDRRNTFQVAISDGSNPQMGLGNNVCFSYDTMCWTTGNFDGGVGGFGSVPGVVGGNRGDGVGSFTIGELNHDGSDYAGPNGTPGGVHFLDGKQLCFSTATTTGNICAIPLDAQRDAIRIEPGQAFARTLHFVSPEGELTTSLSFNDPSDARGAGLSIATTPGNPATMDLSWTPSCTSLGSYALVVHAADQADTPCVKDTTLQFEVTCDDGDPTTTDSCDPASGCRHTPDVTDCDDGNPCTDDAPSASEEGCVHTANHASCDDGNACTTRDHCGDGQCKGGGRTRCDDGDPCTRDSCRPAEGCVHVASDDDADGVCNRRDVCEESILTPTVVVGTCDSHVPNTFFPFGCSISDLLDFCEERHGCARSNRSRCVDQTLDLLRRFGVINRSQRRAIEHCYGR